MRPTLSTTYSIIHGAIGTAVDPDDGNKHLARVWRSVLEDIGSIAIEPPAASTSVVSPFQIFPIPGFVLINVYATG